MDTIAGRDAREICAQPEICGARLVRIEMMALVGGEGLEPPTSWV